MRRNTFIIGVIILFLFTLVVPSVLYEKHIKSHNPSGMHWHILVISAVLGCLIYWGIALFIFLIAWIPIALFIRDSQRKSRAVIIAFIISCVIAMIFWWPNMLEF